MLQAALRKVGAAPRPSFPERWRSFSLSVALERGVTYASNMTLCTAGTPAEEALLLLLLLLLGGVALPLLGVAGAALLAAVTVTSADSVG